MRETGGGRLAGEEFPDDEGGLERTTEARRDVSEGHGLIGVNSLVKPILVALDVELLRGECGRAHFWRCAGRGRETAAEGHTRRNTLVELEHNNTATHCLL